MVLTDQEMVRLLAAKLPGGNGGTANGETESNNNGSAVITKIDQKTNKFLAGAHFKLVDSNGKVIKADIVTDETGTATVNNLKYGEYYFIETASPTGYLVDTTPVKVLVNGDTKVAVTKKDTKVSMINLSGKKIWHDNNNIANKRPNNIIIDLYRNGIKIDTQKVSATTNWQYQFLNLPKTNQNNETYKYTLQEESVPGYTGVQQGTDFVNTIVPKSTVPKPTVPNSSVSSPNLPAANLDIARDSSSRTPKITDKNGKLPSTDKTISRLLSTIIVISLLLIAGIGLFSANKQSINKRRH